MAAVKAARASHGSSHSSCAIHLQLRHTPPSHSLPCATNEPFNDAHFLGSSSPGPSACVRLAPQLPDAARMPAYMLRDRRGGTRLAATTSKTFKVTRLIHKPWQYKAFKVASRPASQCLRFTRL